MEDKRIDIWDDLPATFKEICISSFRQQGKYNITDGLSYLKKYKNLEMKKKDNDTFYVHYLRMIDIFFSALMYPLELHEDDWILDNDRIRELLLFAEECIGRIKISIRGYKSEKSYEDHSDLDLLMQNMNVYLLTSYRYAGHWNLFSQRMELICRYTERNIQYLLLQDKADELWKRDYSCKTDDFYLQGLCYWQEPLAWVYHEALFGGYASKVIEYFKNHVLAISNMKYRSENKHIYEQALSAAKKRLQRICELAIEEEELQIDEFGADVEEINRRITEYERCCKEITYN